MYGLELEPECHILVQDLHCYDCSLSFSDLEAFKNHHHTPHSKLKPSSSAFAIWNARTNNDNVQTRKTTRRSAPPSQNQYQNQKGKQDEQNKKEASASSSFSSALAIALPLQNVENTASKCIEGEDTIQVYCLKCFGTFQSLSTFLSHLGRHSNKSQPEKQKPPPSPIIMQHHPLRNKNTNNININQKLKTVPNISKNSTVSSPTKKIITPISKKSTSKPSVVKKTIDKKIIPKIDEPSPKIETEIKREIEDSELDMELDFDDNYNDPLSPASFQPHDSPLPPALSPAHFDTFALENCNSNNNIINNDNNNNNESDDDNNEANDNNNNESDEDFIPDDSDEDYEINKRKRRRTSLNKNTNTTAKREYKGNSTDGFQCEICPKKFPTRFKLRRHEGCHEGLKRYPCKFPGCDKKYASSTPMYRHRVVAHGIGKLKYKCEWKDCPRMYFTQCEMRKHLPSHQKAAEFNKEIQQLASDVAEIEHQIDEDGEENENDDDEEGGEQTKRKRVNSNKNPGEEEEEEEENSNSNTTGNENGDVKCSRCPLKFPDKHKLLRHQKVHTGVLILSCEVSGCDKKFKSYSSFRSHKAYYHDIGKLKYKCEREYCARKFFDSRDLKKHYLTHKKEPQEKNHPCTYENCSSSFYYAKHLEKHIQDVHLTVTLNDEGEEEEIGENSTGSASGSGSDSFQYECTRCYQTFKSDAEFKEHKKVHVGKKDYHCKFCHRVYESFSPRARHHATAHGVGEMRHKCMVKNCDRQFYTGYEMKKHLKSHVKALASASVSDSDLAGIPAEVLAEKPRVLCSQCGKTYPTNSKLQRHIEIVHQGLKKYLCPHCGRSFGDQGTFGRHINIHMDKRPFTCDFEGCGKKFRQSGALTDHLNIHKNIKPHMCSFCGRTFVQSFTLRRHLQTHTGEKPYKCDWENCGAEFLDLRPLKKHKLTHVKKEQTEELQDEEEEELEAEGVNELE